jgi:MFS family permease
LAYGLVSVVLALYLAELGLSEAAIGGLLTLTLVGDAAISLWLTTRADRIGRRRVLLIGAGLMVLAGAAFLVTRNPVLLTIAAIVGVISPSGNEIGPFLSVEQASLTSLVPDQARTGHFARYNLVGSFATATGALSGGWIAQALRASGWTALTAYRTILIGYVAAGLALAACFLGLSAAVEAQKASRGVRLAFGLHRSRTVVLRLSSLFALDAFAGGLIVQSMFALWFHLRFGAETGVIGSIFFGANVLAGVSALAAVRLSRRFGLVNTMVFTHIPSNILLMLLPLMPTLPLAIAVVLLRFSISQMDVPTRQSYTMAVVAPDERSAASGVTGVARSVGASLSPSISGVLLSVPGLASLPLLLCGGLKILYDLLLWRQFRDTRPPEERAPP